MTDDEITGLRRIIDRIETLDQELGGWTTKTDNRQTGLSLYLKFVNKVDVTTTMQFAQLVEDAPGLLLTVARKLLETVPA